MPYIDQVFRDRLDAGDKPVNTGELNYKLTRIVKKATSRSTMCRLLLQECERYLGDSPRYSHFNDVVGALTCCSHETKRRGASTDQLNSLQDVLESVFELIDPYEDKKRAQNGDVQ